MVWLKTQRLVLRDFQQKDLDALAPIMANPQVMQFSPTGTLSVSQTKEKIDSFLNLYKVFGFGKWAVILQETQELIGYCGISVELIENVEEKEIGYRLAPKFWGNGLATEAALAAIKLGFEQFNLPYILGVVEGENTASVKVLEKLGMQYQKETIFYGVKYDVYRLNASD